MKATYDKKYYQEHREQIRQNCRDYYKRNRKRLLAKRKVWYKQKETEALELLGNCCFVCGKRSKKRRNLVFHEKAGVYHSAKACMLALKNPDRFVLLCQRCHRGVHWCMNILKMTWIDIMVLMKALQ